MFCRHLPKTWHRAPMYGSPFFWSNDVEEGKQMLLALYHGRILLAAKTVLLSQLAKEPNWLYFPLSRERWVISLLYVWSVLIQSSFLPTGLTKLISEFIKEWYLLLWLESHQRPCGFLGWTLKPLGERANEHKHTIDFIQTIIRTYALRQCLAINGSKHALNERELSRSWKNDTAPFLYTHSNWNWSCVTLKIVTDELDFPPMPGFWTFFITCTRSSYPKVIIQKVQFQPNPGCNRMSMFNNRRCLSISLWKIRSIPSSFPQSYVHHRTILRFENTIFK